MLLPILLIIACSALYWLGGESREKIKWTHTLFRDWGCALCIVTLSVYFFGWTPWYFLMFGILWGGLTLGDDVGGDNWYWSLHGFVVAVAMCVVSVRWGLALALAVALITYLVSKFGNKWGFDIWLRGALYGSMPVWLKLVLN